jgi:hypothetical protein
LSDPTTFPAFVADLLETDIPFVLGGEKEGIRQARFDWSHPNTHPHNDNIISRMSLHAESHGATMVAGCDLLLPNVLSVHLRKKFVEKYTRLRTKYNKGPASTKTTVSQKIVNRATAVRPSS